MARGACVIFCTVILMLNMFFDPSHGFVAGMKHPTTNTGKRSDLNVKARLLSQRLYCTTCPDCEDWCYQDVTKKLGRRKINRK
ncbi:hypothetical protein AC249_AIPGENE7843 [Exaiptasia diaphana]|nr:hypothetical protein AC249_AIPGENE7843 [Exaiptasia diaphana]